MDKCSIPNENTFKNITSVSILLVASVAFRIIGCLNYFMYHPSIYVGGKTIYSKGGIQIIPLSLSTIILSLLAILPPILLLVYISKLHSKSYSEILLPVVYLIMTIDLIEIYYNSAWEAGMIIIACILAIINSFNGFRVKAFHIIAMALYFLRFAISVSKLVQQMSYFFEEGLYVYIVAYPAKIIGFCFLSLALLLFGLQNRIPSLSLNIITTKFGQKNPEIALRLLKKGLELRVISEDEYNSKRTELLNKLV